MSPWLQILSSCMLFAMTTYSVLAFYAFLPVKEPHALIRELRTYLAEKEATARIYISEEGINAQMSIVSHQAKEFIDWFHEIPGFEKTPIKIHDWHEQAFPRLIIKYRKKLVATDEPIDMAKAGGEHISPARWSAMLKNENNLVLDIRNGYEWDVGHFKNSERPPCHTFRDFERYAVKLQKEHPPEKPVMMCCTGGIRCELFSILLKEKGFKHVYQLDGGIINYGLKEGSKYWQGKLFVFDDRMTVPVSDEPHEVVGKCYHCQEPAEDYYNCASMDCNFLFLCCPKCLETYSGCCQGSCQESSRKRPLDQQQPHKPFRRWYHYFPSQTPA